MMNRSFSITDARSLSRGSDKYKSCIDRISKEIKRCAEKGLWEASIYCSGSEFGKHIVFDVCQLFVSDGYQCYIETKDGGQYFEDSHKVFISWSSYEQS